MSVLTNSEFAVVQRVTQLLTEKIAALGLDVFVEHDFREFVRLRQAMSPKHILNPTYHPDYCRLTASNSFWLRVVDGDGRTVATVAKRVIDTECFHDDLVSLRLWHDPDCASPAVQFRGIDCQSAVAMCGRIAHGGGLWIEPEWRKINLSGLLADLCRGLVLRNFGYDHLTAVMLDDLARTGIGTSRYGYPHIEGRIDVEFYRSGTTSRLVFAHISKDESIAQMHAWLLFPELNSLQALDQVRQLQSNRTDHELVNTTSIAREWKNEPSVRPGQIINARDDLVVERYAA